MYNWCSLVDGLMQAGYRVHLAHVGALPQYAGLKHTNDSTDARHLAPLSVGGYVVLKNMDRRKAFFEAARAYLILRTRKRLAAELADRQQQVYDSVTRRVAAYWDNGNPRGKLFSSFSSSNGTVRPT